MWENQSLKRYSVFNKYRNRNKTFTIEIFWQNPYSSNQNKQGLRLTIILKKIQFYVQTKNKNYIFMIFPSKKFQTRRNMIKFVSNIYNLILNFCYSCTVCILYIIHLCIHPENTRNFLGHINQKSKFMIMQNKLCILIPFFYCPFLAFSFGESKINV